MFPAKFTLQANDKSIQKYTRLAHALGVEEADWKYEWGDGGKVTFAFKNDQLKRSFIALISRLLDAD